jgi:hypothetical protein
MRPPGGESVLTDRAVFIVGTRRSGTTWLSELMLAHPDIGGPGTWNSEQGDSLPIESLMFGAIADLWVSSRRIDLDGLEAFLERDEIYGALRRFCDRLFESARDHYSPGASFYLDKSPDNVDRIPIMAAIYPDAWYVHIVRDGRDVSKSTVAADFPDISSMADAVSVWARGVGGVQREGWRLKRLLEVRYETLLADPLAEVARIFEWLGLPATDEVLAQVQPRSGKQVAKLGSVGPPKSGKWRDMDPADLATIYEIGGDLLAELGYIDPSASLT